MKLSAYLRHRGDAAALAHEIGVREQSVYRWRDGKAIPRRQYMAKIEAATGGKVRPKDFYADSVAE